MSTLTPEPVAPASPSSDDVPDVPIFRLSVEQYHQMARAGILTEDDPVEFLEGWLVRKMTKHRPHSRCTHRTRRALESLLPPGWYVDSQEPVTTTDSEPEPDVAVVRGDVDDYPDRQPGSTDVPLVIEIADATLRTDRGAKKRLYARAGIPVYWIANLAAKKFEVYTQPTGPAARPDYRHRQDYGLEDEIPVVLDGEEIGRIPVREMLP